MLAISAGQGTSLHGGMGDQLRTSTRGSTLSTKHRKRRIGNRTQRGIAVSMSRSEVARLGGLAVAAKRSPQERQEISRRARLVAAANTVLDRPQELSPEHDARLRALFGSRTHTEGSRKP